MKPMNAILEALRESATIALADKVRHLKNAGRDIIALQTGDPDFPTPAPVIEAAHAAMRAGCTHYSDSRGLPELRKAIASKLDRVNGISCDPGSEILVTSGGVHAYFCALQAIVNPGEEVLVPDPAWMTHANLVKLVGGTAVRVAGMAEDRFLPSLEAWREAITRRTVALVINSPNNPTGTVATKEYLEAINEIAAQYDIFVISDEVYENILFDGREHVCFATLPGARPRTLLVNSLSKTYAMTGWRVGYLVGPGTVIGQALKASQHTITNLAPFVQKAAVCALTDDDVHAEARRMALVYSRRRENAIERWRRARKTDVQLVPPEGAFYFMVDVRKTGLTSEQAARSLLEKHSLALIPGNAFGSCGEGFLRITIAASDEMIMRGIDILAAWPEGGHPV